MRSASPAGDPVTGPGRIQRATYGDQVADLILELIRSKPIPAGAEIPSEKELAARFGVNRLVIREAIRTLVAQELLISSQGRPARVATPTPRVIGRVLQFLVQQNSLSYADLLRAREIIEGQLAAAAAQRVADGDPLGDEPGRQLAAMKASLGDRDAFVAADIAFHRAITSFGEVRLLQLVLDSIQPLLLAARQASWAGRQRAGGSHQRTLREHDAILHAVRDGDPARAGTEMTRHLARTVEDLTQWEADR